MDFKQMPTEAWIEEVRARFPTEATVDEALTRKLRSRAGPAYAPSALSDIEDRLRAFLAQEEPGAEVSGVLPLGGGASKEQYRFDLSRDGVSRTYVLRREPPESIVETHRLREYQLMRAVAGVVRSSRAVRRGRVRCGTVRGSCRASRRVNIPCAGGGRQRTGYRRAPLAALPYGPG